MATESLSIARVAAFSADGVTPTRTDLERLMGRSDLLDLNYFWRGLIVSRAVARIVLRRDRGGPAVGYASGFMVSPQLMLTNCHVFRAASEAAFSYVEFDYERGLSGELPSAKSFAFEPDVFFFNDETLDYALVAVSQIAEDAVTRLDSYGWLRMNPVPGKVDPGEYVSIIQHPQAQPKQIAVRENQVTALGETMIEYRTDTEPGSSGSPVFNDSWQVVALHHSAVPDQNAPGNYVANEGIRISVIVAHLRENAPDGEIRRTFLACCAEDKPWSVAPIANVVCAGATSAQGAAAKESSSASDVRIKSVNGGTVVTMPVEFFISPMGQAAYNAYTHGPDAGMTVPHQLSAPPAPEEKLDFDADYASRAGYAPSFLGVNIPLPRFDDSVKDHILADAGGAPVWLPYRHFSVATNKIRRLPHVVASNVDYGTERRLDMARKDFGSDQWKQDPRIDTAFQTTGASRVYSDTNIDQGHVNRREDNCWGSSEEEVIYANSDTFHYTNCTPQHKAFNRSSLRGVWGQLENHITRQSANYPRFCLFAGPVFSEKDTSFGTLPATYQVPRQFWKVIAVLSDDRRGLKAYGFVLDQSALVAPPNAREEFDVADFKAYQVSLSDLERTTGLKFPGALREADVLGNGANESDERKDIRSLSDVVL